MLEEKRYKTSGGEPTACVREWAVCIINSSKRATITGLELMVIDQENL